MVGLSCLLLSTIISVVILVWFMKEYKFNHDIFGFSDHDSKYCTTLYNWCVFVLVGLAAYYAKFIQLGLDQLLED